MPTQHESGTQVTTVDTKHVLNTTDPDLTDGVFSLKLDVSTMGDGDVLIVRGSEKVIGTGETAVENVLMDLVGVQTNEGPFTIPEMLIHGWNFSIERTSSSALTIKWSIRKA